MAISAYLNFRGNCREAVDFYAEAFGAAKQPVMTLWRCGSRDAHG